MFVSSYNTYISANNSQRVEKERVENSRNPRNSFESEISKESTLLESKSTPNLPISYVSNYKAFSNKQKLQEEVKEQSKTKYAEINSMKNAEIAYKDNSEIFSFFLEPKTTQNQTPIVDKKLPSDIQELQEKNMRHVMVNTYLENDKYYQITA